MENRNLLLDTYKGASGIKTGFTALAGDVLVASATRSGRTLIAVAMDSVDATADAATLLDFGFARLRRGVMVPAAARLVGLVFASGGSTGVLAARTVRGLTHPSDIDVAFVPDDDISLPIASGDNVGVLEIRAPGGRVLATVDAIAERGIDAPQPSLFQTVMTGLMRGVGSLLGDR